MESAHVSDKEIERFSLWLVASSSRLPSSHNPPPVCQPFKGTIWFCSPVDTFHFAYFFLKQPALSIPPLMDI